MIIILSALVSLLSFRFRGRASLELELIALRHQVTVLRRQRPTRCCERDVSAALHRDHPRPQPKEGHSLRCYPEPDASLACASNDRGVSLGHSTSVSAAGPRRVIWSGVPRSHPGDGNQGGRYGRGVALAGGPS